MASMAKQRQQAWDARMKRINSGRTIGQIAEAEGTVPQQFAKQGSKRAQGFYGIIAWIVGGGLGWGLGTGVQSLSLAVQLNEKVDLRDFAPLAESYADPLIAGAAFLLLTSVLRVHGLMPRVLGLGVMAWLFAQQAGVDVPTLAEVVAYGQSFATG